MLYRRFRLLAAAVCLVALLAATGDARAARVEGQVFDQQGESLAGVSVVVSEVPQAGRVARVPGTEPVPPTRVASALTDEHGFFVIELGARSFRGEVFVGCENTESWDGLRYAVPPPREIGDDLRRDRDVTVTFRVEDAPGWHELVREIERVGGPDSKRGKILRRRGMPPETLVTLDGRVEWRYKGVTFVFEGGELTDIVRDDARVAGGREMGDGA